MVHDIAVLIIMTTKRAAPMHMTPNYSHIPVMCYHLQPLKTLYKVTGPPGTQPQQ